MIYFQAFTPFDQPALHLWREGSNLQLDLIPIARRRPRPEGWFTFACHLDHRIGGDVRFMLFDRSNGRGPFESDAHQRVLPRRDDGRFARSVWFVHGAARVLTRDPLRSEEDQVHIQLITARRYRDGQIFLWNPRGGQGLRINRSGETTLGPYWDLPLHGPDRHFFLFKFIRADGGFEPDAANRLWSSRDGARIWVHSEARDILSFEPQRKELRLHMRQEIDPAHAPVMHVWEEGSDFVTDVVGEASDDGWSTHTVLLYTGLPYRALFWNPTLPKSEQWESPECKRDLILAGDTDLWTLEGDRHLFQAPPEADRQVKLKVAVHPPTSWVAPPPYHASVWVNRARASLHPRVEAESDDDRALTFTTYPNVVTSVRFGSGAQTEAIERHTLIVPEGVASLERFVVLERPPLLESPPPSDLFRDPPFWIRRPGAYEEGGRLRFVLHAPGTARARVVGEWTGWLARPVEMRSTRDGSYWWAEVPVEEVRQALPNHSEGRYHGARYKFLLDDAWLSQDPAAGWVENSAPQSASRLLQSDHYTWRSDTWHIPTRDYLTIYQLHPSRFSGRFDGLSPLRRVAREVEDQAGYLRQLGVTALQLMPVNEVGTQNSWGYDPAFFYAIEHDYGGPDDLKHLVDTCHRHGLAVLLDVVFNHAGHVDNILWHVARDSYFDGDTDWGAMINFRHPQSRHFFEQNLVYLQREFRVDGFRFDMTRTIVHSHEGGRHHVREPGQGGGWEFLHGLRHAVHTQADARCTLIAEHLPNDWALTNFGGPMDSQWCDDFHDRLVDASKGHAVLSRLADAMTLSHTACDDWYKVTNYSESHDEVGNVNDRIANVAGFGRGLRLSKVAAAATLLSRGIPMFFMGAESAEHRQFHQHSSDPLDLDRYLGRDELQRVRAWWNELCQLRRDPNIQGPSLLGVRFAEGQVLAFCRGLAGNYYVLLNFGFWAGWKPLAELNLPPWAVYRELWNSTWPAFAVEFEDEHTNGGRDARLDRGRWLHVPDYGVVVLQKV